MNKSFLPWAAATLLALGLSGCESTGGIAARTQEKSAVYATLQTWEKKYIEKGTVAVGFTPDMVYMALGHPTKVAARDFPEGHAELWIYSRSYPNAAAIRGFKHSSLTIESAYQSQHPTDQANVSQGTNANNVLGEKAPANPERGGTESIAKTGGPQGGSMEPADVPSYTIQILFEGGQAVRLSALPNPN
jgi:hypothetical protein